MPSVASDNDPARIKRNREKVLAQQDQVARLARADKNILDAVIVRVMRIVVGAGGEVAYEAVHAKLKRSTEALEVAYTRGHIAASRPSRCRITAAGVAWFEAQEKPRRPKQG